MLGLQASPPGRPPGLPDYSRRIVDTACQHIFTQCSEDQREELLESKTLKLQPGRHGDERITKALRLFRVSYFTDADDLEVARTISRDHFRKLVVHHMNGWLGKGPEVHRERDKG